MTVVVEGVSDDVVLDVVDSVVRNVVAVGSRVVVNDEVHLVILLVLRVVDVNDVAVDVVVTGVLFELNTVLGGIKRVVVVDLVLMDLSVERLNRDDDTDPAVQNHVALNVTVLRSESGHTVIGTSNDSVVRDHDILAVDNIDTVEAAGNVVTADVDQETLSGGVAVLELLHDVDTGSSGVLDNVVSDIEVVARDGADKTVRHRVVRVVVVNQSVSDHVHGVAATIDDVVLHDTVSLETKDHTIVREVRDDHVLFENVRRTQIVSVVSGQSLSSGSDTGRAREVDSKVRGVTVESAVSNLDVRRTVNRQSNRGTVILVDDQRKRIEVDILRVVNSETIVIDSLTVILIQDGSFLRDGNIVGVTRHTSNCDVLLFPDQNSSIQVIVTFFEQEDVTVDSVVKRLVDVRLGLDLFNLVDV